MSEKFSPIEMLDKLISFDTVSRNSNLPIIEFIKDYLIVLGLSHILFIILIKQNLIYTLM